MTEGSVRWVRPGQGGSVSALLRLMWLRLKRRGLMRERARLHQQRAGIDWMLEINAADARQCERDIETELERRRRARFSAVYRVQP